MELKVAKNTAFEESIAAATGAAGIVYAIKSDGTSLPDGITLSGNGLLSGMIAEAGEILLTVTASAPDCASADATVTITVSEPWLSFEPAALQNATEGSYYTGSVAVAKDGTGQVPSVDVSYRIDPASALPDGLVLSEEGMIHGTPTEAGIYSFTVLASADGFTSAQAYFSLRVNPGLGLVVTEGKITFTDDELNPTEANTNYSGAISANTSNRQTVTFEITSGDLPEGITFYSNGTLSGKANQTGDFAFTVTASAPGCESVTKTYTLSVLVSLIYKGVNYSGDASKDLFVGESCSVDLATAALPAGFEDTHTVITYEAKSGIPEGMTLSENGVLSGTPAKSARLAQITVIASAEGFSSKSAIFTFHIEDAAVSGVTCFEAEYTDLRGKAGAGYSGSAQEAGLIDSVPEVIASRSKNGKDCERVGGGFYIPYTYGQMTFEFLFESDKAVSGASLSVYLDSEIAAAFSIDPSEFDVRVNGNSLDYGSVNIENSSGQLEEFLKYTLGSVDLVNGRNTIVIELLANDNNDGNSYCPAIDALELENLNGATLSWRPALYNLPSFTQN